MARDKLGPIPDDHFENDHEWPPKNVSLTQAELDWLEQLKKEVQDKYKPGDLVGGYWSPNQR